MRSSLGMNMGSLQKIIKAAGNDDVITMRADQDQDTLGLLFESPNSDRTAEYEMRLMDIDQEHLGIPDTVYDAEVKMPSTEFARIIRDLKELGESLRIDVGKEGVRFFAEGDIGTASVTVKPTRAADDEDADMKDDSESEEEDEQDEQEEDEDEDKPASDDEEDEADPKPKKKAPKVEDSDDDEEGDVKPKTDESPAPAASGDDEKPDKEAIAIDDEDDDNVATKPTKKRSSDTKGKGKASKKAKLSSPAKGKSKSKSKSKDKGKEAKKAKPAPHEVVIVQQQAVSLNFAIKYLSQFAKSTSLSDHVLIKMANEVPLLVEYPFEGGYIRYYLAPKISDE